LIQPPLAGFDNRAPTHDITQNIPFGYLAGDRQLENASRPSGGRS
jgi:hypothetical protein